MSKQTEIGKEGELFAREYLEKQGYRICHINWHWHHYELDIVALTEKELVIVEVKTRSANYWMAPEDAVDRGKIKRIVTAADAYARFFNIQLPVRFDIITLIKQKDGYRIEHIDDAFLAPTRY